VPVVLADRQVDHAVFGGRSASSMSWRSRGRCPDGSQRIRPASMIIMSNIVETLLLRNLQEVFGEGDPERRRSAIEELYLHPT
jgi:hypothetical protein